MKTNIYTIYDKTAQESGPLLNAKNDGVALRQFQQATAKAIDSSDYTLLFLGTFDHETNVIELADIVDEVAPNLNTPTEEDT